MEFYKVIEKRQSIRRFKSKRVEEAKIKKILEIANSAPSAGNLQSYRIYKIDYPLRLIFCADIERSTKKYGDRGRALYSVQDATIACAFAHLACVALRLGSVWVGAFNPLDIMKKLELPDSEIPVAILFIGYPNEKPPRTPRRKLGDIVKEKSYP